MGRFHRHDDGTAHEHDHGDHPHDHDHGDHTHGHDHGDHTHDHDHGDHTHDHDHGDHSAYETGLERVTVLERIFGENDRAADSNRALLDGACVKAINLMSSPGAGKTALLEHTLRHLRGLVQIGVVEGDIETSIDADRLNGLGAQVALINTSRGFGGECHLDAPMVNNALQRLDLDDLDLLFVENVGNLVCPAEFDVGAHHRVMICSVTEGEDKPLKYPVMFRSVDLVVINKTDLLPYLDLDIELLRNNIRAVNPDADIIELSTRTGWGLGKWYRWLEQHVICLTFAA